MRSALNFVCRPEIVNLNHVILHSYLQYDVYYVTKTENLEPVTMAKFDKWICFKTVV